MLIPSAGSAYAYVSREIHPALGYFTGWSIIFDYIMNTIICVIWMSMAAKNIIPAIPFWAYAVAFTTLFTAMNLRGIEASSRTNAIIAAGLGVVIVLFLGAAVRYSGCNRRLDWPAGSSRFMIRKRSHLEPYQAVRRWQS